MKKFVIFTEGRGELIFIRHILLQVIGYEHLSFKCFNLISDRLREAPYYLENQNASVYYLIINVGTDERVLSAIQERHEYYLNQGYEIIGLRDMYSASYKKRTLIQINQEVNNYFHNIVQEYIQRLHHPEKIHFFFAIMELEAWILGLYSFLERVDPLLTAENIMNNLGFDLGSIDPETTFFHPALILKQVLNLANINYDKHISEMERIVSRIMMEDINRLLDNGRCNSFASLFLEFQREFYASLEE